LRLALLTAFRFVPALTAHQFFLQSLRCRSAMFVPRLFGVWYAVCTR
jgi:hypothetical protein